MASVRAWLPLAILRFALASECQVEAASKGSALLQVAKHVTPETIIHKHFHGIRRGGSHVRENLVRFDETLRSKEHSAAWACSEVDFSEVVGTGVNNVAVRQIMETLHLTEYCGVVEGNGTMSSDPTCQAFWAGIKAHIELQTLGFVPRMENFMIVNWYVNEEGHFPSWGNSNAVSVNYSEGYVKNVTIHRHNAVSPYAFCDIMYTVMRQNFDQAQRGQCGPTAVLAALAHLNPAGAIERGLELYWTGALWRKRCNGDCDATEWPFYNFHDQPLLVSRDCDYIYHDMPAGVVPFGEGQPGTEGNGRAARAVTCFGNEADCANSANTPFTNAGLQGMWSTYFTVMRDIVETGDCAPEHRAAWVTYPGMDPEHHDAIHDAITDRGIQYIMGVSDMVMAEYIDLNREPEKAEAALEAACKWPPGFVAHATSDLFNAALNDEREGIALSEDHPFTLENATYHCGEQGLSNSPDHFVYMDSCYENGTVVSFWTWAGRLYIGKDAVNKWGITRNGTECSGNRASAIYSLMKLPQVFGNISLRELFGA